MHTIYQKYNKIDNNGGDGGALSKNNNCEYSQKCNYFLGK